MWKKQNVITSFHWQFCCFMYSTWLEKISWYCNNEVMKSNSVFIFIKIKSPRYEFCSTKVFPHKITTQWSFHGLCRVTLNMCSSGRLLTDDFLLFHRKDTGTSLQFMTLEYPLSLYIYTHTYILYLQSFLWRVTMNCKPKYSLSLFSVRVAV